ncbi:M16 family metallopeptidase [Alkalilimnicola sp. S0819]|uniref:M16 family metallopeptidase n=1 Tax=Alkalilimnicola sp. S0819 TaxID=2613922 RepID=UPI001261C77B|nr:pitrilysin family protein [Alkalilimnicola sp. S0819]KAB7627363.1 insulinase family protein [Alkalilimnicola sp. S0819]MPQ16081.1 insulinase family protein [Alkalilimnicola sp. S0819]
MRTIFASLGLMLALVSGGALAAPPPVHEYTLDNGLRLLVREDHRAPVAVSMVWYRVGSSYEHRGISGVSHVLEHMMFQGTENLEPGEFSRLIAAEGGRDNAFTSRDYTAYYQQLAADRLDTAFRLEAERMHRLQLREAQFTKELEVVREERRLRVEDRPRSLFIERFMFQAEPVSPYRIPVIGWMEDLQQLRLTDLQRWYQRWYSPGNATVVVAGDVEPAVVHALAQKHFGAVPARDSDTPRDPPRLTAPGLRRYTLRLPNAEVPQILLGYNVPSLATAERPEDAYALEVLAGILDGGSAARLQAGLVRGREIAASAAASYAAASRLDSLFLFSARPAGDATLDALEQALDEEITRLRNELVDESTLERARNQLIADTLFQLDSVFYQAMQLGVLETTGIGWEELDRYEQRVRAVTAEQVREAARRFLRDERLTVARLLPAEESE